jgi:CPA2 family monovalent cation:H+ antiporter-2
MFRLITPTEKLFRRFPRLWQTLDHHRPEPLAVEEKFEGHVVIVGYGRVGRHIVNVLEEIQIPSLVIDSDAERIEELNSRSISTLYGDASNSEVLTHAGLENARALVVAGPDESASELVVAAARDLAPDLPIIARATTEEGIDQLAKLGAQDVIHPELEGGLEIVRHTLLKLGFPVHEIMRYVDAVRNDHYDLQVNTEEEHRLLHELVHAIGNIEVTWMQLEEGNPIIGNTLAEANLRARTGASVVAIMRNRELLANPKSSTVFESGDRVGFIGDQEQVEEVEKLLLESVDSDLGVEWET